MLGPTRTQNRAKIGRLGVDRVVVPVLFGTVFGVVFGMVGSFTR
jgi:hypothetical protein